MTDDIPTHGNLRYQKLPQLLSGLKKQRKTGILTLQNENVKKSIYMRDGRVIFASSSLDKDRLGDMLVSMGRLTSEQYDEAKKISRRTGKRIESIFVELGYLMPNVLFREVKHQVKEILLSILLWEDGLFVYKEIPPSTDTIALNLDAEELIKEGINRKEKNKKLEENQFLQRVRELHDNIYSSNYYDFFGVSLSAPFADIKRLYLRMAREYHPDKYENEAYAVIKSELTAIFSFLNEAYDTLGNKTRRAEYDASFLKKLTKKDPERKTISAEERFFRGVDEFKKGNFWSAADLLRGATREDPGNAKYWAYLSLSLNNMPKRSKEAEESMMKAIELEPYNAKYHESLGNIYLKAGLTKRAVIQFETALKWGPANKKVMEEIEKLKKNLK